MARLDLDTAAPRSHDGIDDVLIVGGGLAGIFTALKLAPRPVTILTAAPIGEGASSAWAQGGMAAAVAEGDTPEKHFADTLAAGAGIVDAAIARIMTREARERIEDLLGYGVPFDRDLAGRLTVGREAAHSERRIVHVRGDMAGQAIMAALIETARATPSIRLVEGFVGETLATDEGRVTGVVARPAAGGAAVLFPARTVVLATGGVGHLYAVTTNPPQANGHGLAMAARAGARLADPEFVQFHPTAVAVGRDPAPLATEALRGEGAILIDAAGRRFMPAIHPEAELAPRDIVARAIHAERTAGRGAFLDCRAAIGARFAERFPTVHTACMSAGIDPALTPIPVAPAAHYHMGGVWTDADGRTSIDGLWACGEVASTGAHGANRLASNSLLEAVVFAARIADDIRGRVPVVRGPAIVQVSEAGARTGAFDTPIDAHAASEAPLIADIREAMQTHVGVLRDAKGIAKALTVLDVAERKARTQVTLNMIVAARIVATAAFARTESRGGHYRSDFPASDPTQAHRTLLTLDEARRIAMEATADRGRSAAVA